MNVRFVSLAALRVLDSLHEALAARGRKWGDLNRKWRTMEFDYTHGSPAWKRSGSHPVGTTSSHRRIVRSLDVRAGGIRPEFDR